MLARRLRQTIVLFLSITLVSLLAFAPTTFAQNTEGAEEPEVTTLTSDQQTFEATTPEIALVVTSAPSEFANIRTGPSTQYAIHRTVMPGTLVSVLGQDSSTAWLSVRLPDNTEGWIARFLTNYAEVAPTVKVPPLAPPATIPGETIGVATIVTAAPNIRVNVRSGPSTAYTIIHTLASGTRVGVRGQDATGAWLGIRLADGAEGWVTRWLTDFATQVGIIATPPLTQQPPLAPPAQQIPAGQVPTAPPAGIQLVSDPNVVTVAPIFQTNVNIRSGPSLAHTVIRTVSPSTQLAVTGQDATNLWLTVRLSDGTQGWIARYLTNYIGTVPIVEAGAMAPPPLAPPATIPPAPSQEVEPGVMALPGQNHPLTNPPVAAWLADHWRNLAEGETHWYAFQHAGDSQTVQIWMDSQPHGGAGFRIYSAANAQAIMSGRNPNDLRHIGAGTPNANEPGHLFWRGDFAEQGTYYVMVEHGGLGNIPYTLYAAGPGF